VIAVGAGFPPHLTPDADIDYAIYGLAGRIDFNWDELQQLDVTLDEVAATHRVESFEGAHQWAPAEESAAAMAWMELVAMAEGRRAREGALIDELYSRDLESARRLEEEGRVWEAWHRYAAATATFELLRNVDEARAAAERLAGSKQLKLERRDRERRAEWELEAVDRARRAMGGVPGGEERRSLGRVLARFDLEGLKRRAASGDPEERLSAQRVIESVFVQSAFYVPRDLLDEGQFERALLVLRVAGEIEAEDPRVWFGLAQAHARLGEEDEAFGWLEKLVGSGMIRRATLEQDPHLEPLRGDARFGALLSRIPG
jgi:tetratricopeptide (TPR) repeat protein